MKQLYTHGGKAYLIHRRILITKFEQSTNLLNMDKVKVVRDWLGIDHVLRDQTHFLFCETIQDIEFEEIIYEEIIKDATNIPNGNVINNISSSISIVGSD